MTKGARRMGFADRIKELAERALKQTDHLQTEEATKNALVMPLITPWLGCQCQFRPPHQPSNLGFRAVANERSSGACFHLPPTHWSHTAGALQRRG